MKKDDKDNLTIGYYETIGPLGIPIPQQFKSNNKKKCLFCEIAITLQNDSGWEYFTQDGVTTQPVCLPCHNEMDKEMPKNFEDKKL